MVQYHLVVVFLAFVFSLILTEAKREGTPESGGVNSENYDVSVRKYKTKLLKEWKQEITLSGKGISDVYRVPSSIYGLNIITTDQVLLVHSRDERNPLLLFSDTPSVLVDINEKKCLCLKYIYKTKERKTTSTNEYMNREGCEALLEKIAVIEKKASNPYKEVKRKVKLAFQKIFPPEFFEALKTDKPVDNTNDAGWNSW